MKSLFNLSGSYQERQSGLVDLIGQISIDSDFSSDVVFYDGILGHENAFGGFMSLNEGFLNLSLFSDGNPVYLLGTGRAFDVSYDLQKQNDGSIKGNYTGVRNLIPQKGHYDSDLGIPFWMPDMNGKIFGGYVELNLYK